MTKRSEKIRYYRSRLGKLLKEVEAANKVEERYRSIRFTLLENYPNLVESVSKETMCEFLRDAVWVDRELRRFTEGKQRGLKDELEQKKLIELETL